MYLRLIPTPKPATRSSFCCSHPWTSHYTPCLHIYLSTEALFCASEELGWRPPKLMPNKTCLSVPHDSLLFCSIDHPLMECSRPAFPKLVCSRCFGGLMFPSSLTMLSLLFGGSPPGEGWWIMSLVIQITVHEWSCVLIDILDLMC